MEDYKCDNCKRRITNGVYRYSLNTFKKALCFNCQNTERIETGSPEKLVKFMQEYNRKKFNVLEKKPRCTKCNAVVKGDTNGMCQVCAN